MEQPNGETMTADCRSCSRKRSASSTNTGPYRSVVDYETADDLRAALMTSQCNTPPDDNVAAMIAAIQDGQPVQKVRTKSVDCMCMFPCYFGWGKVWSLTYLVSFSLSSLRAIYIGGAHESRAAGAVGTIGMGIAVLPCPHDQSQLFGRRNQASASDTVVPLVGHAARRSL
jgi:hypothetical protein